MGCTLHWEFECLVAVRMERRHQTALAIIDQVAESLRTLEVLNNPGDALTGLNDAERMLEAAMASYGRGTGGYHAAKLDLQRLKKMKGRIVNAITAEKRYGFGPEVSAAITGQLPSYRSGGYH